MAQKHSTTYIFIFAAAVCLVCSIFVSGAAVALKPLQETNKVLDRQAKVLSVAGLVRPGEELTPDQVHERYEANIVTKVVDLETGEYVEDVDPATYDMRAAMADPNQSVEAPANQAKVMRLPKNALVYHVMKEGKIDQLILPVQGKGLWSTLYGFLALEADGQTITGIVFYEHAETPGLGGEVENPKWRAGWKGRKAYGPDGEPKIEVIKGSAPPAAQDPYAIDGLSGATITSRGVSHLVQFWLSDEAFKPYVQKFREETGKAPALGEGA